MPEIFVYVSPRDEETLAPHLRELGGLALALRQATAGVFEDIAGPQDVELRMIVQAQSSGADRVLIFAGASMTEGRRAYAGRLIRGWARALSVAWEEYFQKSAPPKLSYDFSLDNVGVWTTLPEGEWFRASDAAIGRFV